MRTIDNIMGQADDYARAWADAQTSEMGYRGAAYAYRAEEKAALRAQISAALTEAERKGVEAMRAPVESAWQPIETAPKDTEVFIGAFIDEEFHFGRSALFYEQGNAFEGETWSGWVWSIDDCSESVAESPTHWMPIPDAPSPT